MPFRYDRSAESALIRTAPAPNVKCHRALQNQPLMGASKPATTLGGSRPRFDSTRLDLLFKVTDGDRLSFSVRDGSLRPGGSTSPQAADTRLGRLNRPPSRRSRSRGRFGWF